MTDREPLHPDLLKISTSAQKIEREAILAIVRAMMEEALLSTLEEADGAIAACQRIEAAIMERGE